MSKTRLKVNYNSSVHIPIYSQYNFLTCTETHCYYYDHLFQSSGCNTK